MKRKFRVLKARGGKDASKDDFNTPSSGSYSKSYNPGAGGVVQHGGTTTNITTGSTNTNTNKKSGNIPIMGPVTLGINLVKKYLNQNLIIKVKILAELLLIKN